MIEKNDQLTELTAQMKRLLDSLRPITSAIENGTADAAAHAENYRIQEEIAELDVQIEKLRSNT